MKKQMFLILAAFGLLSLNPLLAQSTATMEHSDNRAGDTFHVGETIKITFSTAPSWHNSKIDSITFDFEPVSDGTASRDFHITCSQAIVLLPGDKMSCEGPIAGPGIFAGSYKLKQIYFAPEGLIPHWAPITSAPIKVDGPSSELQKRLDETKFESASVSH